MDQNDNILVEKVLSEDEAAFEMLLKKYLKPVYNFLFQLTGDRSALDDLTKTTFIKAWKELHRFSLLLFHCLIYNVVYAEEKLDLCF